MPPLFMRMKMFKTVRKVLGLLFVVGDKLVRVR